MWTATEHFMVNNKKAYSAKYGSENRKKKKKNGSKNRDFDCSRLWHDNRDCVIDRLSMPTLITEEKQHEQNTHLKTYVVRLLNQACSWF